MELIYPDLCNWNTVYSCNCLCRRYLTLRKQILHEAELEWIIRESEKEQRKLAPLVVSEDQLDAKARFLIGIDVAYKGNTAYACAIAMDFLTTHVRERSTMQASCDFPYIPGHFHLREYPIVEGVLKKLSAPGVMLIDGNGILHPRRCGFASYLGIKLDVPTIGVAKSLLLGKLEKRKDNRALIREKGEILGCAIWLGKRAKPIYVSIGHYIRLETALAIVEKSSIHGFPEPLRLAHICAQEMRKEAHDSTK
ncbi:MAG: endonuclease V [Candidatus Thorarchaeota archaeon]|nr:endonuclease V [Candidatus Thorarchaeota archaeon]